MEPWWKEPWWERGGILVEPWWNHGGTMVEPWWNPGGTLVEAYLKAAPDLGGKSKVPRNPGPGSEPRRSLKSLTLVLRRLAQAELTTKKPSLKDSPSTHKLHQLRVFVYHTYIYIYSYLYIYIYHIRWKVAKHQMSSWLTFLWFLNDLRTSHGLAIDAANWRASSCTLSLKQKTSAHSVHESKHRSPCLTQSAGQPSSGLPARTPRKRNHHLKPQPSSKITMIVIF